MQWGATVYVTGLDVVPSMGYEVRADCGRADSPVLTAPIVTTTVRWGDTAGNPLNQGWTPPNGVVNFLDVSAVVDGFQGSAGAGPLYPLDLYGCVPDRIVNFIDISGAVDGFRGKTYSAASLCAQPSHSDVVLACGRRRPVVRRLRQNRARSVVHTKPP